MARLRIDIDDQTYERLVAASVTERRPIPWQAEEILRRALSGELPLQRPNPDSATNLPPRPEPQEAQRVAV